MKKRLMSMAAVLMCSIALLACGKKEAPAPDSMEQIENVEGSEEGGTLVERVDENGNVVESAAPSDESLGENLRKVFLGMDSSQSAMEIAEAILADPVIDFAGATVEVQEGLLTGFDNAEIKGFSEGAMFAPMIGSMPFVAYVFEVPEDVSAFMSLLGENANPRWNVCTQADETIIETSGDKVFFVMCPASFDE